MINEAALCLGYYICPLCRFVICPLCPRQRIDMMMVVTRNLAGTGILPGTWCAGKRSGAWHMEVAATTLTTSARELRWAELGSSVGGRAMTPDDPGYEQD